MKTTKIFDVTEKARIYHTLAQLSSSFSSIVRYCADLEQAGALTSKAKNRFQAFTVEVQGELNLAILEHMDGIEMGDWARGGKVRDKWEKYTRRNETAQQEEARKSTKTQPSKESWVWSLNKKDEYLTLHAPLGFEHNRQRNRPLFCITVYLIRQLCPKT